MLLQFIFVTTEVPSTNKQPFFFKPETKPTRFKYSATSFFDWYLDLH